jgi:hypothetical protein
MEFFFSPDFNMGVNFYFYFFPTTQQTFKKFKLLKQYIKMTALWDDPALIPKRSHQLYVGYIYVGHIFDIIPTKTKINDPPLIPNNVTIDNNMQLCSNIFFIITIPH